MSLAAVAPPPGALDAGVADGQQVLEGQAELGDTHHENDDDREDPGELNQGCAVIAVSFERSHQLGSYSSVHFLEGGGSLALFHSTEDDVEPDNCE